jgi:hypothetical protein
MIDAGSRLLHVGFDVDYINPTNKYLLTALSRAARLSRFGPGYVDEAALEAGLDAYVERHGPFDAIVIDEFVIQDFSDPASVRFVNHACRFDPDLLRLGAGYFEFMKRYKGTRLISLLQTDYYNTPESRIERIEAVADYFIGYGEELVASRDDVSDTPEAGVDASVAAHWQDHYLRFAQRHRDHFISMPNVLGDDDFYDRLLVRRKVDWTVVGADYDARVQARRALDAAGIARSGRRLPYVFSAFDRLRLNPYSHYWSIGLLQKLFHRALRQARFGYTCGSVCRMAIGKFFEFPAAGCVLVAQPCHGFADLGFVDGVNAIVSAGADVVEVHRWLTADLDRAQGIADAGRRMVAERHSMPARVAQLRSALELIRAGDFGGSRWRGGELMLRRASGAAARTGGSEPVGAQGCPA